VDGALGRAQLQRIYFAARVVTSTQSDIYSAVTAAIGALKGSLHGGANEAVMHDMLEIGYADRAAERLHGKLTTLKEKVMGFGHRVYKHGDSRVPTMKDALTRVAAAPRRTKLARHLPLVTPSPTPQCFTQADTPSTIHSLTRKSMHGEAIHPLSLSVHHPATRWPNVTVAKIQSGLRAVCRSVRLDLFAWTLRLAVEAPCDTRGRHREQVAARRRENHFGAESNEKYRRPAQKG
jgi:Citrate synthase, C-terminal domain